MKNLHSIKDVELSLKDSISVLYGMYVYCTGGDGLLYKMDTQDPGYNWKLVSTSEFEYDFSDIGKYIAFEL